MSTLAKMDTAVLATSFTQQGYTQPVHPSLLGQAGPHGAEDLRFQGAAGWQFRTIDSHTSALGYPKMAWGGRDPHKCSSEPELD